MTESKSASEVERDIAVLREWITTQPHLPQDLEDKFLLRFLHSCYYTLENTKKCIETFFTIRAACPELLSNRDPTSPEMRTVYSIINVATIRLQDNTNLLIWQLNDPGMEKYDYLNDVRLAASKFDLFLLEDEFLEPESIILMDIKDVSFKILKTFNMSLAKKLGQYQKEAMPLRLKEVHLVNAPSFMNMMFSFMKSFLPQEICELVHFHKPNSDTLYQYLNRDELPADFGGKSNRMEEHMREWVMRFEKQREFLANDKLWTADESKRPIDKKITQNGHKSWFFWK